jgi:hypothetical protein
MKHETYKLKTLDDVHKKVPKDRRKAFLEDFALWLEWRDEAQPQLIESMNEIGKELIEALGLAQGIELEAQMENEKIMHWVDDDNPGNINIQIKEPVWEGH